MDRDDDELIDAATEDAEGAEGGDDDAAIIEEAKALLERCQEEESEWREAALEDIRFARLGEQWPAGVLEKREAEGRPSLTINKMPAFIRQVVNDARQNKPSIKVHAVDSAADPKTADIINGLIRSIENISNADVAYDTAVECAVSGAVGHIRVGRDYAYDDVFDMDLMINRVANPFSVYGDPDSEAADSSDWNKALVIEPMLKDDFIEQYGSDGDVDFSGAGWDECADPWLTEDTVLVAEYWKRVQEEREIILLSNGRVFATEDVFGVESLDDIEIGPDMDMSSADEDLTAIAIGIVTGQLQVLKKRMAKTHRVTQYIVSGTRVLEVNEWPGRYIPISPVYGDEFNVDGKRYFRSLIHFAKDAQRMYNYWRSAATELVALAPRVPYIGPVGAFSTDPNWSTANSENHPYLEYDPVTGASPPQRQPLDSGAAAGALQEALNANDDMKAIIGLYDASLGARSNETSGRAILARQREGDVATFHFIDNLTRAIRHTGRIVLDLIPSTYDKARIVRVLGEDGTPDTVQINKQTQAKDSEGKPMVDETGAAIMALHDLTAGKYDLTVASGPSFTTRREEAAQQMTELVRAFPQAAPVLGDLMAKNFDWPGADEVAKRLAKLNPTNQQIPPELQAKIKEGMEKLQKAEAENQQLKAKLQSNQAGAMSDAMRVQGDQAKIEFEREKLAFEREKMAFERDKMMLEHRRFMAENAMREEVGDDGEARVVSKADETSLQMMAALQMIAQTLGGLTEAMAAMTAPKTIEIVRDETTGRAIGARSAPMQ